MYDSGIYYEEKIDANHSWDQRVNPNLAKLNWLDSEGVAVEKSLQL